MKRVFLIMLLALGSFITQAQTISLTGSDASTDTITNAGTVYLSTAKSAMVGKPSSFSIQVPFTNVSGTSTFKVILQGTIDGTNWTNIHQVEGTNGVNCDTLQVTSLSPANWVFAVRKGSVHSVSTSTFVYTGVGDFTAVRLKFVGTGSQSTIVGPAKLKFE